MYGVDSVPVSSRIEKTMWGEIHAINLERKVRILLRYAFFFYYYLAQLIMIMIT